MASGSGNSEKYLKTKKTLRALLLSSKGGCSVHSLVQDYKYLYGDTIPYKELGFGSLMELLHDMSDAVSVHSRRDGVRLYGIPDETTRHIAGMVAKQKTAKGKRYSPSTNPHPSVSMITRRGPSSSWCASKDLQPSAESQLPKAPLTFQAQLKMLFLSYPNGVALHDFAEAFARRFGYYFSYRGWGFTSLEQVLKSIPEVVVVETDPVRDCRVVKLVKKTSGRSEGEGEGVRKPSIESINSQKLDMSASVEVPQPSTAESLNSLELSPDNKKMNSRVPVVTKEPPRRRRINVPKKVVGQIETILRAFPAGIWISRFPIEFKKYFDEDFPVSALGFSSVVHMLTSTPVCEVERPTGMGDWLVFRSGGPRPKVADNHQFLHEAYVADKLVKDIHKLLKLHPKGIPLDKFTALFEDMINDELPIEEIGFNSITELLQRVPGIDVSKPPDSAKLMVFCTTPISDSETESSDSGDRMSAKEKDAMLSDVSSQNRSRSVYARQQPPSRDVRMCPVYVTHVKTPSCFCVQLIGEKTTKVLEALQEDMTVFYNSKEGDGYAIKEPYAGQPCCSIFNNDGYWYRAEIFAIPTFDIVEVHYVDYGNSAQVPLASIRRPKAHYLILPAQSIGCRLANLKPAGSTWSRTATQLLYQMTKDKAIVAIISAIENNCMSVCLCDTNTDRDIHINDCLCNQGLALFNADTIEDQRDFDGYQLESPNLVSADQEDVRTPGDIGRIASLSVPPTAPPRPTTQKQLADGSRQTASGSINPLPSPTTPSVPLSSQPSTGGSILSTNPTASSSTSHLSPANPSFPSQPAAAPVNLPPSSPYVNTATPPLPMSSSQFAQLQMQTYLQHLLLFQQNALFGGGAIPMLGLQTIPNPLIAQKTGQTGLKPGQAPPGFAPPSQSQSATTQNVTSVGNGCVSGETGQTSQTGQAIQEMCMPVVENGQHSGLTGQTSQANAGNNIITGTARQSTSTPSAQPTSSHAPQMADPAHLTNGPTHPSEDATIPSVATEAAVVASGGSAKGRVSSASSSRSSVSSSISSSSEGETLQSFRRRTVREDSCLADSESEALHSRVGWRKAEVVPGSSQLYFSGGVQNPAWTMEKAFIKRVNLTIDHSLSVLRHDDKAYVLSAEVSEWFWESDLLQSMLRQVQKPCWGLIMTETKNKKLFQTLRRVDFTSRFVIDRHQVTVYSLEDLPQIVMTFSGPADLCTAVRDQVEAWQTLGLAYFTQVSKDEIQKFENTLSNLKEKKKNLVQKMMYEDEGAAEEGGEDSLLNQLIEVKKKIADVNKILSMLKRVAAAVSSMKPRPPSSLSVTTPAIDKEVTGYEPSTVREGTNSVVKESSPPSVPSSSDASTNDVRGDAKLPPVDQNVNAAPQTVSAVERQASVPPDVIHSGVAENKDLVVVSDICQSDEVEGRTTVPVSNQSDDAIGHMTNSAQLSEKVPPPQGPDMLDAVEANLDDSKSVTAGSGSELRQENIDESFQAPLDHSLSGTTPRQDETDVWDRIDELGADEHVQGHIKRTDTPDSEWASLPTTPTTPTTPPPPPHYHPGAVESQPSQRGVAQHTWPGTSPSNSATPTPHPGSHPMFASSMAQWGGYPPSYPPHSSFQSNLPPRFARQRAAYQNASHNNTPAVHDSEHVKKRPVGIGRGGRPLPPLDNVTVGSGGIGRGYHHHRQVMSPQSPPVYMVPQFHQRPPGRQALLPPPLHPHHHPSSPGPPLQLPPEEGWMYVNHRRPYLYHSKFDDFPPFGSGAGLDII